MREYAKNEYNIEVANKVMIILSMCKIVHASFSFIFFVVVVVVVVVLVDDDQFV